MLLLSPYMLLAASAILVPIAIHLWNRRQGKTVKVGSLRWLEASASSRWKSIKLNNLWLLLLRCLILILLAVALAEPVWVHQLQKQTGKKVVYVAPELLYTTAIKSIKPAVDSLLKRGYTLHAFKPEMELLSPEKWQQLTGNSTDTSITHRQNHWSLLPALAEKYTQTHDSVWLFTSDLQRHFTGIRPAAMPQNIRWIPVLLQAENRWVQAAAQTKPDSLLLILGHSNREGITYSRYRTTTSAQSILIDNQQLQLKLHNDTLQAISGPDTSYVPLQKEPIQVSILYEKAQQQEVKYVQAALKAIGSYTGLPFKITASINAQTAAGSDWLFWLRGEKLPESIKAQAEQGRLKVWVQPQAEPFDVKESMRTAAAPLKIHQLNPTELQKTETILWKTSTGEPLLTSWQTGKGNIYTFRSGFRPAWSGLGQSAQLPELLLPVLLPQAGPDKYDSRALDEKQIIPPKQKLRSINPTIEAQQSSLLPWFVLAAFLLFVMERIIAGRRTTL